MKTKHAGDLQRGDGVHFGGNDHRVVEKTEFHNQPVDSRGTTGIRVWWYGSTTTSLIAVDVELETY